MRLADFIEQNIESILAEWVTFARTQSGAEGLDLQAIRDHAAGMLASMVADLRTPQSATQQFAKSLGDVVPQWYVGDSAAETHGAARAISGYSVIEMVAEFRALRASVLRLWAARCGTLAADDLQDLMRFNEAIDQALAESITRFTRNLDQSQDMFVAILTHDLRTPLQTVTMVTEYFLEGNNASEEQRALLLRAARSTKRMNAMIDDLLDFTRTRMGAEVSIERGKTDLGMVARDAVEEVEVAHPSNTFSVTTDGELHGEWDRGRIGQVLANLLGNAVQHGDPSRPISLAVHGRDREVVLEVRNFGTPIQPEDMRGLFGPFKRLNRVEQTQAEAHNLGLGLYIADRIVAAHDGYIDVSSSETEGTCFVAHLPR